MNPILIKRRLYSFNRRRRQAQMVAKALKSPRHPIVAHIIPVRRCNLSCTYCNEYDSFSKPVPTAEMFRRVDRLAALGTTTITISGGEPLLHPELDQIIRRIRNRGLIATLITNGYLLTPKRIRQLNGAGLDHLQISIDNVIPDEVSKKSLKVLDKKLQWLAQFAEFDVNINTVLGSSVPNPEDALVVARRVQSLGFAGTVGIIHDHSGQLRPLESRHQNVYDEIVKLGKKSFFTFAYYDQFQKNLTRGLSNQWHCHAGSRYLYICEDGLVHYCSQQRGYPGIPLEQYTQDHLDREYHTVKACTSYCTVSCVHQVAMIDLLRERPLDALAYFFPRDGEQSSTSDLPLSIRILSWLFLPPQHAGKRRIFTGFFTSIATRLLGVK
jgi:MoaA/NifB/PqqE/SkfB family radical SAM enzyme